MVEVWDDDGPDENDDKIDKITITMSDAEGYFESSNLHTIQGEMALAPSQWSIIV